MKKTVSITDQELIQNILDEAEYGTLALSSDNKPYSVPINFVEVEGEIYFHGAKKGKKISLIKDNTFASFSVVESFSLLPSYFSNDKGNACPATHLYKSVIIDGSMKFVEDYDEKAKALEALMQKLTELLSLMQSPNPAADANIVISVLQRIEYEGLLVDLEDINQDEIRNTLLRQLTLMFSARG